MRDFDKQMEMVLYHSDEGDVSVDAYIMNDSLWITQKAMAELFGVDKSGISRHLKKIFVISVGYRVNSIKATKFRIWARTIFKVS